jgi:uncharacterized membrane protein
VNAGSVDVVAFGFDPQDSLPPELLQRLDGLRGRGILRILDVLFVSKDSHGTFRAHRGDAGLSAASAAPATSTLWHLLVDGSPESGLVTDGLLGKLTSWEVGLDLDWIERLGLLIAPDTSALLMLVEAKWATDLLDAVIQSGGFPIVFGCLERETMLVVGPDLAATSAAALAAERSAARRGAAVLDALAMAQPALKAPTQVIAALVDAGLLEECEVERAVGALVARGLVAPPLLEHARARVAATVADITPLSVRPTETGG